MNRWFEIKNDYESNVNKECLFIFPYAGGGASTFKKWHEKLSNIKIYIAQYPGRENRFSELAIDNIDELVEQTFIAMKEVFNFDVPYYIFGHSMGTKVAYEIALRIKNNKLPSPKGIIISAGRAPCYKEPNPIYFLDDDKFIEGLSRYEGTPKEILENKDLISIFLPTLRADFTIDEEYKDEKFEKINSRILGLMGTIDQEMTLDELIKWQDYTTEKFDYKYIEGKHMFINTKENEVINEIKNFLIQNNG